MLLWKARKKLNRKCSQRVGAKKKFYDIHERNFYEIRKKIEWNQLLDFSEASLLATSRAFKLCSPRWFVTIALNRSIENISKVAHENILVVSAQQNDRDGEGREEIGSLR